MYVGLQKYLFSYKKISFENAKDFIACCKYFIKFQINNFDM